MDGTQLRALMTERWQTLNGLLELSHQQTEAIQAGQMGELMRILSRKQLPIARLTELARELQAAGADDPHSRHWESDAARQECREMQRACERLHTELLAIEAACESALVESRATLEQRISQLDASHQAARRYRPSPAASTAGSRLDLSE